MPAKKKITDISHERFMRILKKAGACQDAMRWVADKQLTLREAWVQCQDNVWVRFFLKCISEALCDRHVHHYSVNPRPEWWEYLDGHQRRAICFDHARQAVPFEDVLRATLRKFPLPKNSGKRRRSGK